MHKVQLLYKYFLMRLFEYYSLFYYNLKFTLVTHSAMLVQKFVSDVGFEPTPSIEDQNTQISLSERSYLESGALDHSAILTWYSKGNKYGLPY